MRIQVSSGGENEVCLAESKGASLDPKKLGIRPRGGQARPISPCIQTTVHLDYLYCIYMYV